MTSARRSAGGSQLSAAGSQRPAAGSRRSAAELRGVRDLQRLSHACAEAVSAQLRPGVTEREAALMQRDWLRERGVRDWLRLPSAWFGERTALAHRAGFVGFGTGSGRRLEPGMPFILRMAPVHRGRTAGVAYSGCLGLNPLHDRLLADLGAHRGLILREVRERRPLREIYGAVERLMIRQGYGHRHRVLGFDGRRHGGRSPGGPPLWGSRGLPGHPAGPGLWSVEPRLGFRGTGATFEEILVVTDSRDPEERAFWLDDDLPHVRDRYEECVK